MGEVRALLNRLNESVRKGEYKNWTGYAAVRTSVIGRFYLNVLKRFQSVSPCF